MIFLGGLVLVKSGAIPKEAFYDKYVNERTPRSFLLLIIQNIILSASYLVDCLYFKRRYRLWKISINNLIYRDFYKYLSRLSLYLLQNLHSTIF